jgi:hypothetical protein
MSSAGIAAANCMLAAIHAQKRREEEDAKKSNGKPEPNNWYNSYNENIAQAGSMISDIDKEIKNEKDPHMIEFLNMRKNYWERQAKSSMRQRDQMIQWETERWERERKEMERFHRIQAIVDPIVNIVFWIMGLGSLFGIGVFIYVMLRSL